MTANQNGSFAGKVALVTGAGSGMGLATAKAEASAGASVVLAAGFCCHTLPGVVPAGPATVCTFTLKPAVCSDVCALCWLRPTTFGTLAAPETKIVILDPGSTMVPPVGFWFTTVPAG